MMWDVASLRCLSCLVLESRERCFYLSRVLLKAHFPEIPSHKAKCVDICGLAAWKPSEAPERITIRVTP